MRQDRLLDLGGIDVEPARDDHVLLAVDDIIPAVGIAHPDVAGMMPAEGRNLGGRFGVLVIARHHQRPAHDDLAAFPGGQDVARLIHDLDDRQQIGAAAAARMREFPRGIQMLVRRHCGDAHRRLSLAETRVHHRPEHGDRFFQPVERHRRPGVADIFETGEVGGSHARLGEQHIDRGRRQEHIGYVVTFDRRDHRGRIEFGQHDDRPAECHAGQRERPRGMRHRRRDQIHRGDLHRHRRDQARHQRLPVAVRQHHTLGTPRRAAGIAKEGQFVLMPRPALRRGFARPVEHVLEEHIRLGKGPVERDIAADIRTFGAESRNAVGDLRMNEQGIDVEQVEQVRVLAHRRAVVRHHPHAVGAQDAEDRLKRFHRIAAEHRTMRAGREAIGDQRAGDRVAAPRNLGVGPRGIARDHARLVMRHPRAAIEIVDHPHGGSTSA